MEISHSGADSSDVHRRADRGVGGDFNAVGLHPVRFGFPMNDQASRLETSTAVIQARNKIS